MKIVVVSSLSKYHFLLNGYSYLFNKFWSSSQQVDVVCYSQPQIEQLPDNFNIVNLGLPEQKYWTNGLIDYFERVEDDYFLLAFDDHFIFKTVPVLLIEKAFALCHKECLDKFWLHSNPQNTGEQYDGDYYFSKEFNTIQGFTPRELYDEEKRPQGQWANHSTHQSLMLTALCAGIWSKDFFLSLLKPDLTGRELEQYNLYNVGPDDIGMIPNKQTGWLYPQFDVMSVGRGQPFNWMGDPHYSCIADPDMVNTYNHFAQRVNLA